MTRLSKRVAYFRQHGRVRIDHRSEMHVLMYNGCAKPSEYVRMARDLSTMYVPCSVACALGTVSAPLDKRCSLIWPDVEDMSSACESL